MKQINYLLWLLKNIFDFTAKKNKSIVIQNLNTTAFFSMNDFHFNRVSIIPKWEDHLHEKYYTQFRQKFTHLLKKTPTIASCRPARTNYETN